MLRCPFSGTLTNMWRWVCTILVAFLAAFWLIGMDPAEPADAGDSAAGRALTAVTHAHFNVADPTASFPSNWFAVMGYRPQTAIGPHGTPILIKPTGDCSSPSGPTEYNFDTVCKEHDLSYDVLRYAGLIGHPLAPAARQSADAMFDRELHARCDQQHLTGLSYAVCHTYAETFAVVVKINSWRQGYRPPGKENPWKWSAVLLLSGTLVAVPLGLGRLRRVAATSPWHPSTLLPAGYVRRAPAPDSSDSRPTADAVDADV